MEDRFELVEQLAKYKKENEELKLKVEELTDFFENASIPLHWVDGDGIIIWANQAELDALGYLKEEYIGFPISDFHADQNVINDILDRLIRNETLYDYSASLKCKDGSVKHVLINSNVLRKDGKFIHTRCFTRDVTEKKYEEQRKNDFVAMVSHELKTPLTAITSYVQLLMRKWGKDTDGFNMQVLSRIEIQAKKMVAMAHDFLSLAKIEDGKIHLRRKKFDLESLVTEIVEDAQLLTTKHNIRSGDFKGIEIDADRDKIGQVLSNLVSNAIKYSPMGGTVTVTCEKCPGEVNISVVDQGIGINKTDQKRLFDRYYRINDNNHKEVSGFGIGLYLVSEILKYHQSEIKVESEQNQGSTFHFALPAEFK
ncbi:ATP-binding protein [Pedobacter miscanthi]|uniref:PAS domain-containing sensor histidine kinase n=1 Tax=Pedobacter miscanthi TaxID=2259170 RepID=UPI00292FE0ED|nr:ATP-binding protein [Pedobacter miscanthi]